MLDCGGTGETALAGTPCCLPSGSGDIALAGTPRLKVWACAWNIAKEIKETITAAKIALRDIRHLL